MRLTVTALFKSFEQTKKAIKNLAINNLANSQISYVCLQSSLHKENEFADELTPTGEPLTSSDEISVAGWVVETDEVQLSKIGKVKIGGPIAHQITSGSNNDLQSALMGYGVTQNEAEALEYQVAKGKVLLLIETNTTKASAAVNTISSLGGRDIVKWNDNIDHGMKVTKSP